MGPADEQLQKHGTRPHHHHPHRAEDGLRVSVQILGSDVPAIQPNIRDPVFVAIDFESTANFVKA